MQSRRPKKESAEPSHPVMHEHLFYIWTDQPGGCIANGSLEFFEVRSVHFCLEWNT